jgi:hypothetical protein
MSDEPKVHKYVDHPTMPDLRVCAGCGKAIPTKTPANRIWDSSPCVRSAGPTRALVLKAPPRDQAPKRPPKDRTGIKREYRPAAGAKLPGVFQQGRNFVKAYAKRVKTGSKNVDSATYEQRMLTCEACPSQLRIGNKCSHPECGCFLAVKLTWQSESCPMGHWKAVDGTVLTPAPVKTED